VTPKDPVGNKTKNLTIRVLEHQDLEAARLMHNDNTTLLQLTDVDHISEEQQEKWFISFTSSNKSKRFSVLENKTGEFVGLFRVDQIDWVNRSACIGLDIKADKRGLGYAKEAYAYFFDYYFNQCGLNRLYLATLETNAVALNLYRSLGFQDEGKWREAVFRNGQFVDYIWLGLLRADYDKDKKS
jgi:RimJ/RimL family protein N-acetyltransferase